MGKGSFGDRDKGFGKGRSTWDPRQNARNMDLENEKAGRGFGGGGGRYSDHDDRAEGAPEPQRREGSPGGAWKHDLFDIGAKVAAQMEASKKSAKEKAEQYDPLEPPAKEKDKDKEKDKSREPSEEAPAKKGRSRSRRRRRDDSDDKSN